MVELIIFTGVTGGGKTLAMQCFEESGYQVTDNIPVAVADEYFNIIEKEPNKYKKVALTVSLFNAKETFELALKHKSFETKFVGITCSEAVLNERFRLTRKLHPRQVEGLSLDQCIKEDLAEIRKLRDYFGFFIDTTKLSKNEFRNVIFDTCLENRHKFTVSFYSFGYKISVPQDIETVFDVRLLPNPYWVPELKNKNGFDKEVIDYVLSAPETKEYLKNIIKYLDFYLEELKKNDRNHASIGIACSGGQHRSVVIANYLCEYYSKKYVTNVSHKDLPRKPEEK
ncbi:MAG: hypothetical protein MJ222_02505 [Bacilli bacterium]|nr:hypothetical protein [Bacilli bacterium]